MSFEQRRMAYQCPERLARQLYNEMLLLEVELSTTQSELAVAEALLSLEQALRARAENKLKAATPRRAQRDREIER